MSSTKMRVAIGAMVVAWVVAMGLILLSPSLRARYWAWRLERAADEDQQRAFASKLAVHADGSLSAAAVLLKHRDAHVRRLTIDVIDQAKGPAAADLLLGALRDPETDVRDAAALALGKRATPALTGELAELANGDDEAIAAAAVFALQRAACPEAVEVILDVLKQTRSAVVRVQALESLGLLGVERAKPVIQRMLGDLRTVPGPPANERALRRGLAAQRRRLPFPVSTTVESEHGDGRTVGDYAAKALTWIERESAARSQPATGAAALRPGT